MAKNILVLQSSPRKDSNSNMLAGMFMAGAVTAGHHVSSFDVGHDLIHPCMACEHCRKNDGICAFDDMMQHIYPAVKGADVIVLAAPLYFYDFPAQLKSAIDRLYAFGPTYEYAKGKKVVLLMTAADNGKNIFDGALRTYELALTGYLGWQEIGRLLVGGINDAGAITDHPALAKAYQMGYSL